MRADADMTSILITGGAGFIGRRLATKLREDGHAVSVFDNLHPQVHSDPCSTISELKERGCTFIKGDVRESGPLHDAIRGAAATIIVHLAAETGTGQSYDLPVRYCDVNVTATAHLVEAIRTLKSSGSPIEKVILAGSRAVYGEGAARTPSGDLVTAVPRRTNDLAVGNFTPKDANGNDVKPLPSCARTTQPAPASIYASTKLMQEYVLRQGLEQMDIGCGILRLQNVYGAGQSLNNPYTGVLSIFAQQLLEGKRLNIYEDGNIVRDFVHVTDVVTAFHLLCEMEEVPDRTLDIGSGRPTTILEVAQRMIAILGLPDDQLYVSGRFRPGDIRHAVADISEAQDLLEWNPYVDLEDGLEELINWARSAK